MDTNKLDQLVQKFESEIRSNLGALSLTPSGFEKRDCMLCHLRGHGVDRRDRFGIMFSSDSISLHCFNCGYKSYWKHGDQFSKSFREFLMEIGMDSHEVARWQFAFFTITKRFGLDQHNESPFDDVALSFPHSVLSTWKEMDNDFVPFTQEKEELTSKEQRVWKYAKERGLLRYKDRIGWSASQPTRLMIPFYHNRKIVGMTGRSINNSRPKYLDRYSDRDTSSTYLFNYHSNLMSDNEYVIVTDGILDALHTNGVATMRSDLNDKQQELINHLNKRKRVILVPDFDQAGFDFSMYAEKNGWYISTPHWKEYIKDIDDMVGKYGRLLTIYSIIKNAKKDYIAIRSFTQFMKK